MFKKNSRIIVLVLTLQTSIYADKVAVIEDIKIEPTDTIETLAKSLEDGQTTYLQSTLDTIAEYLYKPFLSRFTKKHVYDMDTEQITGILIEKIRSSMDEFVKVGTEAKAMQNQKAEPSALRDKHSELANIFCSMRKAEPMLRAMYPKMNTLFDQLIEFRENLDYSISDLDIKNPDEKTGIFNKFFG